MNIRKMELDDIEQVVDMGEPFFDVSGNGNYTSYSPVSVMKSLMDWIDKPEVALIVAEQDGKVLGCISGIRFPAYFNHEHVICQEMFWWVSKDERAKGVGLGLIEALETWAKRSGCSALIMSALEASQPERIKKIYEQRGYDKLETSYTRSL